LGFAIVEEKKIISEISTISIEKGTVFIQNNTFDLINLWETNFQHLYFAKNYNSQLETAEVWIHRSEIKTNNYIDNFKKVTGFYTNYVLELTMADKNASQKILDEIMKTCQYSSLRGDYYIYKFQDVTFNIKNLNDSGIEINLSLTIEGTRH
jgi:hypothetical protein